MPPKILCAGGKGTASELMYHDTPQRSLVTPIEWHVGEIKKPLNPNQNNQLGDVVQVNFIMWKFRKGL